MPKKIPHSGQMPLKSEKNHLGTQLLLPAWVLLSDGLEVFLFGRGTPASLVFIVCRKRVLITALGPVSFCWQFRFFRNARLLSSKPLP